MTWLAVLRRRWQLTKYLAEAEAEGRVLMDIPVALQSDVQLMRWRHKVEQASDRWASAGNEMSVTEWQAAVAEIGRHRLGRPRRTE